MSDAFTANYGWTKPEVGASDDTWGDKWNANLSSIDSIVAALQGVQVPFGPSGPGHKAGLVPDPGSTAGAFRVLYENGTWAPIVFDITSVPAGAISFGQIQTIPPGSVMGNIGAGNAPVPVGGGLELSGAGALQRSALSGAVIAAAGSGVTTISDGSIVTSKVADDAITFGKIQNVNTDTLIGRDSAGAGDPESVTVGGGIEFTGAGGIQRSALVGAITAAAGVNVTVLSDNIVTLGKLVDFPTNRVLGRATAATGDPELLTPDATIELVTPSGSPTIRRAALTGDIVAAVGSNATVLGENVVKAGSLSIPDSTNLFLDPLFTDSKFWKLVGGATINNTDAVAIAVTTGLNAPTVSKMANGNGTLVQTNDAVQNSETGDRIAVVPGENYVLSLQSMEIAGFTGLMRLDFTWYQGDRTTTIGAQVQTTVVDRRTVAALANAVYNTVVNLTAPANARWCSIRLIVVWSTTIANGGTAYCSWARLIRVPPGAAVMGPSGASHAAGLAPDPGAVAGTAKYLCENGQWSVPPGTGTGVANAYATITDGVTPAAASGADTFKVRSQDGSITITTQNNDATHGDNANFQLSAALQTTISGLQAIFGASGAPHAKGLVPDPGAVAGTAKFLREDASWSVPPGLAAIAANTLLGNNTGGAAVPIALTGPQITPLLDTGVGANQLVKLDALGSLPAVDINGITYRLSIHDALAALVSVAMPMINFLGAHVLTDNFGIPNDGSASGTVGFNRMIDAINGDRKLLSIRVPMGLGIVLDDAATIKELTWGDGTERRIEFKGDGVNMSVVWLRTVQHGFQFTVTAGGTPLQAYFHDLTFQTDYENAGCPLRLKRTQGNVGGPSKYPQIQVHRVNARVSKNPVVTKAAYFGDFVLDIEGWHQASVIDFWKDDSFTSTPTKDSGGVAIPGSGYFEPVRGGDAMESRPGHDPHEATHGHDAYSQFLGLGAVRISNSYSPFTRGIRSTGGRWAVLHMHDFDQAPEGGIFREFNFASSMIGYRSAAMDYQPGLIIQGYGTNRDNNVMLGGPVLCGTSTGGGSNFLTLEFDPPYKDMVVRGTPVGPGDTVIRTEDYPTTSAHDMTGVPVTFANKFVEIEFDDGTLHHSYAATIDPVGNTITLPVADAIPAGKSAAVGKHVRMSMIALGDKLSTGGGPGFGQWTTVASYDRTTKRVGFSAMNDGVPLGANTRWVIESPIVGGRKNVVINDLISSCAYDEIRNDGYHGITYPTDLDLTNANGVRMTDGTIHFGGNNWIDSHRRGIAYGNLLADTDLTIADSVAFDGNGQCCIYNPVDNMPLHWPKPSIAGKWARTLFNGRIKRIGLKTAAKTTLHTGNYAPISNIDGTDKAPSTNGTVGQTYYSELPYIHEFTPVTGLSLLNGSAAAGQIYVILWDGEGNVVAVGVSTNQAGAGVYQRFPFVIPAPFTTEFALPPGRYFAGMQANSASARFRAHAWGAFGTGARNTTTYGVAPTIIAPPSDFVAGVGPIMSLYYTAPIV